MTPEEYTERDQQTENYIQWINQSETQTQREDTGNFRLQVDNLGLPSKTKHFMP